MFPFPPLTHTKRTNPHLDWEHGDALWAVDTVPNAEVSPVLGDHYVTAGHPLDVGAETQHCGLYAALYVVQMELRKKGRRRKCVILLEWNHFNAL